MNVLAVYDTRNVVASDLVSKLCVSILSLLIAPYLVAICFREPRYTLGDTLESIYQSKYLFLNNNY